MLWETNVRERQWHNVWAKGQEDALPVVVIGEQTYVAGLTVVVVVLPTVNGGPGGDVSMSVNALANWRKHGFKTMH